MSCNYADGYEFTVYRLQILSVSLPDIYREARQNRCLPGQKTEPRSGISFTGVFIYMDVMYAASAGRTRVAIYMDVG